MFRSLFLLLLASGTLAGAAGWVLSAPQTTQQETLAAMPEGDTGRGEQVFYASGCDSCHAGEKAQGEAKKNLGGGKKFKTTFGTFIAPNISTHREYGLGAWSLGDFTNAVRRGVSPDGSHYYPAFPYTSYVKMTDGDISDLWAYMKTLPSVDKPTIPHEVSFPFNIRRGLGIWKLLYLNEDFVVDVPKDNAVLQKGRYLAEALGHCGECHTPRNAIGGADVTKWLAGGVAPQGNEKIPNISPHANGIGGWSTSDIAYALETGFTPEFDSFGSTMADVVENTSKLTDSDRKAIAAYLKFIPPRGR